MNPEHDPLYAMPEIPDADDLTASLIRGIVGSQIKKFLFESVTPDLNQRIQEQIEAALAPIKDRAIERWASAHEVVVSGQIHDELFLTIRERDAVSQLGDLERTDEDDGGDREQQDRLR